MSIDRWRERLSGSGNEKLSGEIYLGLTPFGSLTTASPDLNSRCGGPAMVMLCQVYVSISSKADCGTKNLDFTITDKGVMRFGF
jgi:hypothetical protein